MLEVVKITWNNVIDFPGFFSLSIDGKDLLVAAVKQLQLETDREEGSDVCMCVVTILTFILLVHVRIDIAAIYACSRRYGRYAK